MTALFSITPLQQALLKQQTILTPNRRLSRHLLDSHAFSQRQQRVKVWSTPAVFSLESWVKQCWQQLQDSNHPLGFSLLLDPRQELLLWKRTLEQDPATQDWLQPAGAARHAQQALKTLQLWRQLPGSEQLQPFIDEDFVFSRWHQSFRAHCQPLHAISFCDAIERLIEAFQQGVLTRQSCVWLVEFQDIPPLYQALLEAAFEQQQPLQSQHPSGNCQRLGCETVEQEIQLAAQWTRQILQHQPGASIAIVDPQLSARRALHERTFRQLLEPNRLFADAAVDAPLFNMSIGTPLADCPIIDAAFLLLGLTTRPLLLDQLAGLLYSPFLSGTAQEMENRIALELRLRRLGMAELPLSQVQQQLVLMNNRQVANQTEDSPQEPQPCCPRLETALHLLEKVKRQPKRSLNAWGPRIVSTLTQLGWPGERQPSSLEYQQIKLWYKLLAELTRFDSLLPEMSFSDALNLLRTESQSTVFQPQTPDSAVQILGPLEAAGLRFSHLWVMGLNDESWPNPPDLNPLLPAAYQQKMQMPHASAERELHFARQLTQLFASSAEQVVFSHPVRLEDQALRPSALITQFPEATLSQLKLSPQRGFSELEQSPPPATLQADAPMERIDTSNAPSITAAERDQLRGGSAILTNQALCPFSAFAIHRLGAKPLERPQTGLSAADRGNLLHAALEQIWQQLQSQQRLLTIDPEDLQQLLNEAIKQAIAPFQKRTPVWMAERFWTLEQQRLTVLIERWLALERERPEFRVIAIEKALNTELLGMPLRLRIDRIDRLNDGSELLIDYKSGTPNIADWFGERPRQPQLPLYQLTTRNPVSALAFGQVNASEVAFKGISRDQSPLPGISPLNQLRNPPCADWAQMTQLWKQTLEQLMGDFIDGRVSVSPLDLNVYQYSELQPLNRYYEQERLGQTANQTQKPDAQPSPQPGSPTLDPTPNPGNGA